MNTSVFWFFYISSFLRGGRCRHPRHMEVPRLGVESERSATYTTALGNARALTHWARPAIEPATSWSLVRFVSAAPGRELLYRSSKDHDSWCCNTKTRPELSEFTKKNIPLRPVDQPAFFFFPFFKVLLKYNWSTSASFFTSQLCNTFQPLIYRKEFLHNRPRTKTLWRSGDFCNFCLSVKLKVRLLHALLEYSIEGRAGKTAFHLGEEEVWGMAF